MNLITGMIGTACLACVWLMTACQTPEPAAFAQVHRGMSKSQVTKLLGTPSSQWEPLPPRKGDPEPNWSVRWHYGDSLSTTASTALGPDIAPDAVWVVVFDHDGKVLEHRPPIKVDNSFPMRKPPK